MSLIEAPDSKKKSIDNIVDFSKRHKIYDMVHELLKLVLLLFMATTSVERGIFPQ